MGEPQPTKQQTPLSLAFIMLSLRTLVALLLFVATLADATPRPTVLWHGMGDTCCYPFSMGAVKKQIEKSTGAYVHSIEIGGSIPADEMHGFIGNVNKQVDEVCAALKKDANLTGGFNAVGFSQGGQFLRAYTQRCNDPPVHNLVTMGGQHFGVADIPECTSANTTICSLINTLLGFGAYVGFVQEAVVQAQYFRDPKRLSAYVKDNIFLPDINNERTQKNQTYKKNLLSLNQLVLVKFAEDTVVVPRESEWFGYYAPGSLSVIQTMEETQLYKEDWLGLKELNEAKKLQRLSCPGNHMKFTLEWFTTNIITPYLSTPTSELSADDDVLTTN